MNIIEFIKEYQTLIGSFLAIFSTICLWYFKEAYDKRKQIINNKKEINDIFFMMARDTEECVRDLVKYIPNIEKKILENEEEVHIFQHSKFNRIYINEERLFTLKQGLDFILSQQIDIAISSAKKFNSFMESIEAEPIFIFDITVKTIQSGLESKEKAFSDYKLSLKSYLKKLKFLLNNDIEKAQINVLRPVAALAPKYKEIYEKIPIEEIDEILDKEAEFILIALKQDLT